MRYISTRGNYNPVESTKAIILGMVPKGGLFVPESLPNIDLTDLKGKNYKEVAFEVMKNFLTGSENDFSEDEIKMAIEKAYNTEKFDTSEICPLKKIKERFYILELWHGPTAAFKDIALQIMPHLFVISMEKQNHKKESVILVATSGDTGKAALEGFKNVPKTKIIVFYPSGGVSKVQELQMTTTDGKNTYVIGVEGNFDDCQTMVKKIFADSEFKEEVSRRGFEFSSANSINWGRLLPQIVYYFWAYLKLIEDGALYFGDEVNICVPTGNFGNILAAYYAKRMGLPVKMLICASNSNNVLSDFINTGVYNSDREFFKTFSPSMDILISSNLERFLFEISSRNPQKIIRWYEELLKDKRFKVDESTKTRIKKELYGNYATEAETLSEIKEMFFSYNYLIDPHTAVGVNVYKKYLAETRDETPLILCSTASPYKFNNAVYMALTGKNAYDDEFLTLSELNEITGFKIPANLKNLQELKTIHRTTIKLSEAKNIIRKILRIGGKKLCLKHSRR
ncbi:MAG: threonine synthase [Brevinematia bacterium]